MTVCLWTSKGIPKHDRRQDSCRDIVRIDALGDELIDFAAQIRHKMPRECGDGAFASVFGIGVDGGECRPLMQIVLAPYCCNPQLDCFLCDSRSPVASRSLSVLAIYGALGAPIS